MKKTIWKIEKECIGNKNNDGCCSALLEVETTDIYISYINSLTGNIFAYTFRCPCCNRETIIPDKDIPFNIRKTILNIERENVIKYL